jgi:hypothetical protein
MQEPVPKTGSQLLAAISILIAGIFILDLFIPRGVLVPVLYTVPLLLALQAQDWWVFLLAAITSTLLTIVGFFLSIEVGMGSGLYWMAAVNRSLAVITFAVPAAFYVQHRRVEGRLRSLQSMLPYCSACKKVRDDRGYWKQLELYLEEHTVTQFSRGLCRDCLPKQYDAVLLQS